MLVKSLNGKILTLLLHLKKQMSRFKSNNSLIFTSLTRICTGWTKNWSTLCRKDSREPGCWTQFWSEERTQFW